MTKKEALQLFEQRKVRTVWDDQEEKWYFSIVDVVAVLTGTDRPRKYWSDLKKKLKLEGSQLSEKIGQFNLGNLPQNFRSNATHKASASKTSGQRRWQRCQGRPKPIGNPVGTQHHFI
jgi:hypothetical protein